MGFFNNVYNEGALYAGSDFDNLMNDPVEPSSEYLEFDEAALVAVAESEENYNAIIKSIGITEATYFAQTGREMVYTESVLGSIFTKIKEFLKKVWEKIKALFKRFLMMFDKFSKDDKAFLKKYEKAVRRASGEEIEFKGYPFESAALKTFPANPNDKFKIGSATITDFFSGKFVENAAKYQNEIKSFREDSEETFDALRGAFLVEGANGKDKVSSGDFAKELFEATHGSSSKESLDGTDLSADNALSIISGTKAANKTAKKDYEALDKLINRVWIKGIEGVEKQALAGKDSTGTGAGKDNKFNLGANDYSDTSLTYDDGKGNTKTYDNSASKDDKKNLATHAASALLNYLHTASSIVTQVNGALLTARKDKNRQARAICAKYIAKGKTYNAVGESASYSGSFLADVKFK